MIGGAAERGEGTGTRPERERALWGGRGRNASRQGRAPRGQGPHLFPRGQECCRSLQARPGKGERYKWDSPLFSFLDEGNLTALSFLWDPASDQIVEDKFNDNHLPQFPFCVK